MITLNAIDYITNNEAKNQIALEGVWWKDIFVTNKEKAEDKKRRKKYKKKEKDFHINMKKLLDKAENIENIWKSITIRNCNGRILKIISNEKNRNQKIKKTAIKINSKLLSVLKRASIENKSLYAKKSFEIRNQIMKYLPREERNRDMDALLYEK